MKTLSSIFNGFVCVIILPLAMLQILLYSLYENNANEFWFVLIIDIIVLGALLYSIIEDIKKG